MNKLSRRKSNRGDENIPVLPQAFKSRSTDRKPEHHHSKEKNKRSMSKNTIKNEEQKLPRESRTSKKRTDELIKKISSKEKSPEEIISKPSKLTHFGDGYSIKDVGKIQKYVFHSDNTIISKFLHYSLDLNESLLILYDPKKPTSKRSYYVLSAKEIFYNKIKEQEAFQMKVKKPDSDLVTDLILKAQSTTEKFQWLEEFGMKMPLVSEVLKSCIEEVETRRFSKGQKKRNEIKELKDVDIGTLIRVMDAQNSHKLKLSNAKRWNISRLEKLIQILLNEIPQPLIPFELQEILEKSKGKKSLQKDYGKILKRLPPVNHKMLMRLIEHLESLTNYYTKQLNATAAETEKIRRNICLRLTPLIIRQEFSRDTETVDSAMENMDHGLIEKFCTMFYQLMESRDGKKST